MRFFRGKKRQAKKLLQRDVGVIMWALSVKPGDWIHTCEGCNRQVTEVTPIWTNIGRWRFNRRNRDSVVYEVRFTDTRGQWHFAPGGGCASPVLSRDDILRYHRESWPDLPEPLLDANGEYQVRP